MKCFMDALNKRLNIDHFNTSNVTTMKFMFRECKTLESLDLSNFNADNDIYMDHMFFSFSYIKEIERNKF